MTGSHSSSNFKKYYTLYLLDTISLTVVRSLSSQKDVLEGVDFLRRNLPDLVRAIFPENKENRSLREIVKGTGETIGSSLLLLSGILQVGKLWIPAIGFLVGVHGLYRLAGGFEIYWGHRKAVDFLKVYLPCLKLMQETDGHVSDQEVNHLDDLLSSFKLTTHEKKELTRVNIHRVEDLIIPEWFTKDQRKLLLEGCWGMVYCDGVVPVEKEVFQKLAKKTGIPEKEINQAMQATQKAIDEQDEIFAAIGAIGWHLLSAAEFQQKKFLETLFQLFVKRENPKHLEEHLMKNFFLDGKLRKVFIAKREYLKNALGCAFFLCRCRKPVAPETFAEAEKLFEKLCGDFKLIDWGERIKTELNALFEELSHKLLSGADSA